MRPASRPAPERSPSRGATKAASRSAATRRTAPDAGSAPALVRSETMLEGGGHTADRRDLNLDQIVEIHPVQHVDRLDEIDGGL